MLTEAQRFRGLGFRVRGLGFKVWGLLFWVLGTAPTLNISILFKVYYV